MEDLSRFDHRLEPGTPLRGALDRQEQREQPFPVRGPSVFPQRLTERQVLGLGVSRKARRVRCHERERSALVVAVLGQVEVDATDDVPDRVAAPQEFLQRSLGFGELDPEGLPDLAPQRLENRWSDVFGALHRRRREGQSLELSGREGCNACLAARIFEPAPGGHESSPELAPVSKHGGQRDPDLAGAELQKPMTGPTLERGDEPMRKRLLEPGSVVRPAEHEPPMGREHRRERWNRPRSGFDAPSAISRYLHVIPVMARTARREWGAQRFRPDSTF